MIVPFISLRPIHDRLQTEILRKMNSLIERNDFILGQEVTAFEKEYARSSDTRFCIGVSNGLDALKIALRTLNIGPGDEVIMPAHTYIATILAILEVGALPILVEPDLRTYNITVDAIAAAITAHTKAIIPVHLYGQPCEMNSIMELTRKHSIHVIEDNAQAQGATYLGKKTGSFGDINATSFYPSKNLGAMGDAGAITTDSINLDHEARLLRSVGSEIKYHHEVQGYNARLDTLQAGVLNCKLPYLQAWNKERQKIAARYLTNLRGCASITLPKTIAGAEHVYHLFVIRHREREKLGSHLAAEEIQTLVHYPIPNHLQPALASLGYTKGQFPVTEKIAETCLSLPLFIGMSNEQIDFVSEKMIAFDKQYS
jgi:dTDP-4-amino-4,6-dideoxygalactose transaminase